MLTFTKLKFQDIVTSDFGDEVTIRVNAESVKHYARKVKLLEKIDKMELPEGDVSAFNVAAGLVCICTDPETGDYSFGEDQLEDFVNCVTVELFTKLSVANQAVNPSNFEEDEDEPVTLSGKKNDT